MLERERRLNPLQTVDMNPSITSQANNLSPLYANRVRQGLELPATTFLDYLKGLSSGGGVNPFVMRRPEELNTASQQLQAPVNIPGATDVSPIYNKGLDFINNQFSNYLKPSILESFGRRGLRFSSDVANALARTYGDVTSQFGLETAKADVASKEAAAGRQLTGQDLASRRSSALANIGQIFAGMNEADFGRTYQEYLRNQPEAYFQAAQNIIGAPRGQTVSQGFTEVPSTLDQVSEGIGAFERLARSGVNIYDILLGTGGQNKNPGIFRQIFG